LRAAMLRRKWLRRQKEESDRAEEILRALGIAELRHRPTHTLSGGEQRLVELAVAAMRQLKILVLDEPAANLSQESRRKIATFLLKQKEAGICCIFVEHDLEFVREIADQVLVLSRGVMLGIGEASVSSTRRLVQSAYSFAHSAAPAAELIADGASSNGGKQSAPIIDPLTTYKTVAGRTTSGSFLSRFPAALNTSAKALSLRPGIAKLRSQVSTPRRSANAFAYEPLTVRGLCVDYGSEPVIQDVILDVNPGEIVALIGGNGAGKSTTMRAILGLLNCQGSIKFGSISLTSLAPYAISRLGISYVAQHRKVFPSLTVLENLLIASDINNGEGENRLRSALEAFPELSSLLPLHAGDLSGGQQQMVAIARALAQKPRLLLLDEPSAGLSESLWRRLVELITQLAKGGLPILIVEHRPLLLKDVLSRVYLIERGRSFTV
jgi:branched-chain amino acid transport system ATP-binding protein